MAFGLPPAMPPMSAFQNDALGNEAGLQTGLTGNQPTGLSDASLMNAFQNEKEPLTFDNDNNLPSSDQSNFFQPPPAEEQQQPLADAPASEPLAANPWDRSSTVH